MATLKEFIQISKLSGVDEYIFVDQKAKIAAHDIKNSQEVAEIIFSCGQNCFAIGKAQFKYLIFSRKSQRNIFIFPVGNYFLGVVKSKNVDNFILADTIINFLKGLV